MGRTILLLLAVLAALVILGILVNAVVWMVKWALILALAAGGVTLVARAVRR